MTTNPYAPPIAEVQDIPAAGSSAETPFFAVSSTKLVIMSLCTLGLYEVYWFYQNWKRIKRLEGSKILPAARAFFAVLYCYQCFAAILKYSRERGVTVGITAAPFAIGWIIATMLYRLPGAYWLVAFGAVLFMLPIQSIANEANREVAPGHEENSRIRGWNWLAVIVGGLLLILAIIGSLLEPQ